MEVIVGTNKEGFTLDFNGDVKKLTVEEMRQLQLDIANAADEMLARDNADEAAEKEKNL